MPAKHRKPEHVVNEEAGRDYVGRYPQGSMAVHHGNKFDGTYLDAPVEEVTEEVEDPESNGS